MPQSSGGERCAPSRAAYRAVIISPHLDDAVFSIAGEIVRQLAHGPVLVINIFTKYGSPMRRRGVVLGDMRYQEEGAAAAALGYESLNLGELDASCRRPEYRSLGNIFKPPVPADLEYAEHLRARIFAVLGGINFDVLYVPLAVGWHVDHLLAHNVFGGWDSDVELLFYEDLPYCLLPNATSLRLGELGVVQYADGKVEPSSIQHLIPAWLDTMRVYRSTAMIQNLSPWILRQLAVPVVGAYLLGLMHRHARCQRFAAERLWEPKIRILPMTTDDKVQFMMLYASQFKEFFLGADDCAQMMLRYAKTCLSSEHAVERLWSPR